MKFRDYFANEFETSENHYIPTLRSHYYSVRNEQAMEALKSLAKKRNAIIKYVDNERHEMIFEASNYAVTATFTSISYTVTAVDFLVVTEAIFPFGKGKKIIEQLYEELNQILPFKGLSLYSK